MFHVDIKNGVGHLGQWMRSAGDKKATTLRLSAGTKKKLQNAARVLVKSESDLVEDAILEYLRTHNLDTHFVLTSCQGHLILLKVEGGKPTPVEVVPHNGVPLTKILQELSAKVNAPVELAAEGDYAS